MLVVCMLLAMPVYAATDVAVDTTGESDSAADTPTTGEEGAENTEGVQGETDKVSTKVSYIQYFNQYSEKPKPQESVQAGMADVIAVENADKANSTQDGVEGVLLNKDNGWVEWKVVVPTTGIYHLTPTYFPIADSGRAISLSVTIDGASPFTEAQTLALPRIWKDDGEPTTDETGNHIRPTQIEAPHWTSYAFNNELGMYSEPYFFYLEAGEHTVRFERVREAAVVKGFEFKNAEKIPTYEEYVAQHADAKKPTGEAIKMEAESPFEKSDSTLYALTDHQDAATTPNHPTDMLLNIIGGSNWGTTGQSITWKVNVTEAGWYKLAMRARQNVNQGMTSYRTISVNGKVPFAEAVDIPFLYNEEWEMHVLGGKKTPQYLYLEPGDELTITVSAGKLCDVLRLVQQSVLELNEIYRQIIMITGTSPDVYQDYYLEDEIEGLSDMFTKQAEQLRAIANKIYEVNKKTGSQTSMLMQNAEKMETYAGKSYEITSNLGSFKSAIESLSSLLLTFGQQPIEVDCFYFVPVDTKEPSAKATFWKTLVYGVEKFIGSFFNDYQVKGQEGSVEVWVETGRDQMQILSAMTTDFIAQTGVRIRLSLVDTDGTLLKATMAGKGPDLALMASSNQITDLAMRGALVDLEKEYGVYEEIGDHFNDAAWKRFRFFDGTKHGIYGIPETQTWQMMFYRTDVFEQLELTPPKTWDEFYEMLRTLQGQNMNVGMSETASTTPGLSGTIDIFQSILFQKGSTYYNDTLTATMFDTTPAYEAFEQWVDFYGKYGVARSVEFYNRFRTGDIPIGIAGYGTYNQLSAAAPELRGLWKMAVLPGTVMEDGSINHASASGGTAAMVMTAAQKRGTADQAYEFAKWWTDTEQVIRYGAELEATMGVAARHGPADLKAIDRMGWTEEELAVLKAQRDQAENVFAVPGDYLLGRSLTNAFRSVLDQNLEPRRTLSKYNRDINSEITRKRKEFGLDK